MIIRGFLDSSFSPPAPAVKAFIVACIPSYIGENREAR